MTGSRAVVGGAVARHTRRRCSRRWCARLAAACLSAAVLALSGYGWSTVRSLSDGLTRSRALDDQPAAPAVGRPDDAAINILVMGLDSRLDQDGQPLPRAVLDQLHAGDSSSGGYNTNVLMVLHIPVAGEHGAVALSVPRDDFVDLPGRPDGIAKQKIKQGYGLAKDQAERELRAQGVTDRATLEHQGREAGRREAIAAVQQLLGLRVDHFVEVTLVGFYDLARALGSVTVCLTGPTQDGYSGARFDGGYQRLDAAQALAFVRQRRDYVHPELNFTDLDRARRQQAFLASVAEQFSGAGTLTDPGRVEALIDVARRDLVLDDRFDLLSMAERLPALLSGGVSMATLPVRAFRKIDGQDVNVVDPDQIRDAVRTIVDPGDDSGATSTAPAQRRPPGPATVDVVNASGRDGLAAALLTGLSERGLTAGTASTRQRMSFRSYLRYAPDTADTATGLAQVLGPGIEAQPDPAVPPGHVVIVLGRAFEPAAALGPTRDRATGPAAVPTDTVRVSGIPCVK